MAVAYGNYKPKKSKTVLYYIIAAIVIAAGAAIFFWPAGEDKQTAEPKAGTAAENLPDIATEKQTASAAAEPAAHTTTEAGVQQSSVADANALAGPRIAALLKDAQNSINENKFIAARDTLNDVLNLSMPNELRQQVKAQMQKLADEWLFSRTVQYGDNFCSIYKVQPGDLLSTIAAKCKVPYQFLMRINGIENERSLRAGQNLKIVQGPFHAIAYLSSFTMDVYLQNVYVKSYKIGTGKQGRQTPVGLWRAKVGGKLIKPTWTDPDTGKTYTANDPDYPLGSGWIALEGIDSRTKGITGIAIHGTKDEGSIGTQSSRGCLRLYNGELIELYNMFEQGQSELRITE